MSYREGTGVSKRVALAAMAAAVAVGVILLLYSIFKPAHSLQANPDKGAAMAVVSLLSVSKSLQQSFSVIQDASKTTTQYIGYMKTIKTDCQDISAYKSRSQSPSGTASRLKQSATLCSDLSGLASDSDSIYTAATPLLSSGDHVKRYQTLPVISSFVRNQQIASVNKAASLLAGTLDNIKYPSQALVLVKQLQSSMQASHGLAYYPAIAQFQQQLLAERADYWLDYADLTDLIKTLQTQLATYCQALHAENISINACATS